MGFLGDIFLVIWRRMLVFDPKNVGGKVSLCGLGKIGKAETSKNVRKRLKIFERLGETFEK